MQLKAYQEKAIDELIEKSSKLLNYSGKKLIFRAPTGSGKTIMMAEFLRQFVNHPDYNNLLAFIWTAPRQLHLQSKRKLENYYSENRALNCSLFEDLDDRQINEGEILFFNWESINRSDNVYIRENEQENNLSKIIERTKENDQYLVLIIDESHHHATSDISRRLIADIKPDLTIEVSATPVIENPDDMVTVHIEDVKAEGMIKKAVILNENFKNVLERGKIRTNLGSEEIVIQKALEKQKELIATYEKTGSVINPLVLIQLPDRIGSLEDRMKERVISILKEKYKITTENGKLAIWLSGEHINKENVEKSDSEVQVLIFKQAIALGWDCPRAQILALFREWHSPIFSIQTVGRIMRMPEPIRGHYQNEALNYGYIFTNLDNIAIEEDSARDYITVFESNRITSYKPIRLTSCHSKRHREKTRLSPLFNDAFLKEAISGNLEKNMSAQPRNLDMQIISNLRAENVDTLAGQAIHGNESMVAASLDLQRLFDFFVRANLSPFYPEDRSVGRVKEAIYKFFSEKLGIDYKKDQEKIIQIVLDQENIRYFIETLTAAKNRYKREAIQREPEIELDQSWDVPEILQFAADDIQEDRKKSALQPFFGDYKSNLEKAFVDRLDGSGKVVWWFKNGERDSKFFAISYEEEVIKPFYIDFIVQFEEGKIGLFDTKSGYTRQIAGPKVDGFYQYIRKEKKNGKKIFGGIITNTDQRNYKGKWIYFDGLGKELQDGDLNTHWKTLEL